MTSEKALEYALKMDQEDPVSHFREAFIYPEIKGRPTIYFCGNSLGLQPKSTEDHIKIELEDWGSLGVEGHLKARNPWFGYHHYLKEGLAKLTGAKSTMEVTPMGSLTSNLHLMMISFFRPTEERFKIITEAGAFPSDQYALESQCRFHGLDPDSAIIELEPRPGRQTLETKDILNSIQYHHREVALVLLSGVQYYTGQFFDIRSITQTGREAGALVGWDLAHAIGNLPLHLHRDRVDFAVWCTYKYLNSGPGATAGIFVHEMHGNNPSLLRLAGWWGHHEQQRFQMEKGFIPMMGSDGWQQSNANVLSMAAQKASLKIFMDAGIENLRAKSIKLTGLLYTLLDEIAAETGKFKIITPENHEARGCQLSLLFKEKGLAVFKELTDRGVILDWREPDIIRLAPVPLYNRFIEVYQFSRILRKILE